MRQSDVAVPDFAEVLAVADAAGRAILEVYAGMQVASSAANISYKADDSPLTRADLAAHQVIAQQLAALSPSIPLVSEEDAASQAHRQAHGVFWLVDPLDGTKEFLARNDEFTVNIALVYEAVAVLGVVLAPALDLAYWGGPGLGAWRRQHGVVSPITVQPRIGHAVRPWRVLASKSHLNAETQQCLERLGPHELVQAGSSLKFCRIAEGQADLYPRLGPTCEWDTAAAQAVLEGANGHVTDLQGRSLRYGKTDVLNPHFIASSFASAAQLLV